MYGHMHVNAVAPYLPERYGINGEDVLDNILYARAFTHEHLYHLLAISAAKVTRKKVYTLACEHSNMRTCEHANMRICEHANMRICEHVLSPFVKKDVRGTFCLADC
ncbi:meiotic recombination protein DMC1-like protein [Plasmodium ovale wallikeri]|uniref:Meiotic recombination protein DMC1-like protein n=1 Tax=Plasmodium ovale wallikeri TaxID=864142 RepID=A0A1A8YMW0_PLAOA|nr:meiotic recombination protein DMC1-like protein [Plasmodium ovale wallikeri]